MGLALRIEDELFIPPDVIDLASFRRWATSEEMPKGVRIDYLQGTLEIRMTAEELQTHGALKAALLAYVHGVVQEADLGQVFVDEARLSSQQAGLSCEPDIVFVAWDDLRSGRSRYVPSPGDPDRWLEIEGGARLVVEVVSESSVGKDRKRLPPLYAKAGVDEMWRADARRGKLDLEILRRRGATFKPAPADAEGYQESRALQRRVRLRREPGPLPGTWRYLVDDRPL